MIRSQLMDAADVSFLAFLRLNDQVDRGLNLEVLSIVHDYTYPTPDELTREVYDDLCRGAIDEVLVCADGNAYTLMFARGQAINVREAVDGFEVVCGGRSSPCTLLRLATGEN